MSNAAKPAEEPPKKRRKLPLLTILVVLLAAGGGGGYVWWSTQRAVAAEAGGEEGAKSAKDDHAEAEAHGVLLPLDTFTVNLADADATRFLRANVQLVLAVEDDVLKELEHEKVPVVRARAAVLELLAEQTSDVINTPAGKLALKAEIRKRAGKALHHEVADVLFSDFVIQF